MFVFEKEKKDSQTIKEFEDFMKKYEEKATKFYSNNYLGHMNYDISRAHYDAFVESLKYNQNIVAKESSPLASELEKEFIQDIGKDMGFSENFWGYISSGGTISNIEALWIARNKLIRKKRKPTFVLVNEDHHYSIEKACNILNLQIKPLKVDPNVPPDQIAAVICICGSTETGRCDDIITWKEFCMKNDIHLHIDAAYGGYYRYCKDSKYLTESSKIMLNNLHLGDSLAIDPHKLGYAPYPGAIFLLKDKNDVMYINSTKEVRYLGVTDISLYTIEGSRAGAIAASLYYGHKQLKSHYKEIMENNLIGTELLVQKIISFKNFEIYPTRDLGLFLFRDTKLPMSYLREKFCNLDNINNGKILLVTTTIGEKEYFRVCMMDPKFKDYVNDWFDKFMKEYNEYNDLFNDFVKQRVSNIMSIAEECQTEEELEQLIRSGKQIIAYNGFEPSGRIHIAQAIITVLNANLLVKNGCHVKLYIADWFAKLNHKMGGDLEKIRIVGKYFIEVFKACGISRENIEFIWASDLMFNNKNYWERVLDITTKTTYKRAIKCSQIMGRQDSDNLDVSQLIYPCMQAADIFEMKVDIPQLGLDQRKCNMLAREYAGKIGVPKPVSVAHHMLMGLKGPKAGKMSKSIPDSAIFMEDDESEVKRKINNAFCNDEFKDNPIFEYIKYIIIRWFKTVEFDGKKYNDIKEIENDFKSFDKKQLKEKVAEYINKILEPVRKHFSEGEMKKLKETVASFNITR